MELKHLCQPTILLLIAVSPFLCGSALAEDLKIACETQEMRIVSNCSNTHLKSRFEFKIGKDGFDMGKMDSTFDPDFHFQASYMTKSEQGNSTYLQAKVEELHPLPETPQNFTRYLFHSSSAGHDGMKLYDSVVVDFNDTDASGDRRDCPNSKTATMVCILAKASDTFADLSDRIALRFHLRKLERRLSAARANQ